MAASFGPSMGTLAGAGVQKLAVAGANPAIACGPLNAWLQGAVALVLRGNCTFATKVGALAACAYAPSLRACNQIPK